MVKLRCIVKVGSTFIFWCFNSTALTAPAITLKDIKRIKQFVITVDSAPVPSYPFTFLFCLFLIDISITLSKALIRAVLHLFC